MSPRATVSKDQAVQELQDQARAKSGQLVGRRWRLIEGQDEGQDALLVQRFSGGRAWTTVFAIRLDGTTRAP